MSLKTNRSLRDLKRAQESAQQGTNLSPETVARLLELAIATIERLLHKRPVWQSVAGNRAIDSMGRMWECDGSRWELESEGPPDA